MLEPELTVDWRTGGTGGRHGNHAYIGADGITGKNKRGLPTNTTKTRSRARRISAYVRGRQRAIGERRTVGDWNLSVSPNGEPGSRARGSTNNQITTARHGIGKPADTRHGVPNLIALSVFDDLPVYRGIRSPGHTFACRIQRNGIRVDRCKRLILVRVYRCQRTGLIIRYTTARERVSIGIEKLAFAVRDSIAHEVIYASEVGTDMV